MNKLNSQQIQAALRYGEVKVFEKIDSTNEYLLNHYQNLPIGSLCLAETQTAGRGRRGRQWYSPPSDNLYFSLLWRYEAANTVQIPSLSLLVALTIAETFQHLNVENIEIKWPNDILYRGKKMGGILIESKIERNGVYLVIGIGLNLTMERVDPDVVTQAWSALSQYHFDRNILAATLANALYQLLQEFPHTDFSAYLPRWHAFDHFYGKPVKLITATEEFSGISQGINQKGELLLAQPNGIRAFSIGEISLRGG